MSSTSTAGMAKPARVSRLPASRTFREIKQGNDQTAILKGKMDTNQSYHHYYRKRSAHHFLQQIKQTSISVNASDLRQG